VKISLVMSPLLLEVGTEWDWIAMKSSEHTFAISSVGYAAAIVEERLPTGLNCIRKERAKLEKN